MLKFRRNYSKDNFYGQLIKVSVILSFSVAIIEFSDKSILKEKRFIFHPQFQDTVHHGGEAMAARAWGLPYTVATVRKQTLKAVLHPVNLD